MLEYFKEIIEAFKERAATPLFATYGIMFAVLNWKGVLILLFGGGDITERISLFEANTLDMPYRFLNPVAATLALLVITPFVKSAIFAATNRATRNLSYHSQYNSHLKELSEARLRAERATFQAQLEEAESRKAIAANERKLSDAQTESSLTVLQDKTDPQRFSLEGDWRPDAFETATIDFPVLSDVETRLLSILATTSASSHIRDMTGIRRYYVAPSEEVVDWVELVENSLIKLSNYNFAYPNSPELWRATEIGKFAYAHHYGKRHSEINEQLRINQESNETPENLEHGNVQQ